jgi:hypothetical protein
MRTKDLNSCLSQIEVLNRFWLRFGEESEEHVMGKIFLLLCRLGFQEEVYGRGYWAMLTLA